MINKFQSGQAMIIATIFFLVISTTIILGLVGPITRQQKIVSQSFLSRQSYFLAESIKRQATHYMGSGMESPL